MNETSIREEMQDLVNAINRAIYDAENFANEYNLNFNIEPAWGMGGRYDGTEGEWYPSSQSC